MEVGEERFRDSLVGSYLLDTGVRLRFFTCDAVGVAEVVGPQAD